MANTINQGTAGQIPYYAATGTDLSPTPNTAFDNTNKILTIPGLNITKTTYTGGFGYAGISYQQFFASPTVNTLNFVRGRGTTSAKALPANGDQLANIVVAGWNGSTPLTGAGLKAVVSGTPSSTSMPTEWIFGTHNGSSFADRVKITKDGQLNVNSISNYSGTDITISPSGKVVLGDPSKINVSGGSAGQSLTTDGAGNLSWTTVTGLQGPKGDTGDTGPKGDTGDKGDTGGKGDKGDTGATGAAATITVGTVTTGAAGSSASVTNVGTTSSAIFNFAIPQGAKGDKGDNGSTGATGVGISTATVNSSSHLIITKTDSTTVDAGSVLTPSLSYDSATGVVSASGKLYVASTEGAAYGNNNYGAIRTAGGVSAGQNISTQKNLFAYYGGVYGNYGQFDQKLAVGGGAMTNSAPLVSIFKNVPANGGFPDTNYTNTTSIEWSGGESKFGKWRQYHNAEEWSWAVTYNVAVDPHTVFPATYSNRDSNDPSASIVYANRVDVAEGHSGQNFWGIEWAPAKEDHSAPDWAAGASMRYYDGGILTLENSWGNSAQWSTAGDPKYQPSGTFRDSGIQFVSGYTVQGGAGGGYSHVLRTSNVDGSFKVQDVTEFKNSSTYWTPITPPAQTGIYDVMTINKAPTYDVSFKGAVRSKVLRYTGANGSTVTVPVGTEILALDGNYTSLTIKLPPNAVEGQHFTVTSWGNSTGITWDTTGYNTPALATYVNPDNIIRLVFVAATAAWFKC